MAAWHSSVSKLNGVSSTSTPACILLIFSLLVVLHRFARAHLRSRHPLPPGPKPLPIIGNAADIPTAMMARRFKEMTDKHGKHRRYRGLRFLMFIVVCHPLGDVVHLDALGQPMIILGSHEAALELLDKRSANYSDRPPSAMREL